MFMIRSHPPVPPAPATTRLHRLVLASVTSPAARRRWLSTLDAMAREPYADLATLAVTPLI